jgi:hypothetical protein
MVSYDTHAIIWPPRNDPVISSHLDKYTVCCHWIMQQVDHYKERYYTGTLGYNPECMKSFTNTI